MPRAHARGDGTTVLRGTQWWAVIPLPADGARRRRWWQKATPNTETGAEKTRRQMLREVADRPRPVERQRLGDWLSAWLTRRETQLRPNTMRYEQQTVRHLSALHGRYLDALTPAMVQGWVDEQASRYAPKTVAGRLTVLRMALALAVDLELIGRNPAARVKPPRIPHTERPILSEAQARALLANVEDTPYLPVFGLAVAVGLRQGEVLGLRWADVDLEAGRLTVRRQPMRQLDGTWDADAPPKTPAGYRTVPIPPPIVAALSRHRDRQRLLSGRGDGRSALHPGELVCMTRAGRPIHAGTVAYVWHRERRRIGAPAGMTFHDLRHSAASLLAALGIHPSIVAAMLGHSRMEQTGHYTHASASGLTEAAAAMGRVLEAHG